MYRGPDATVPRGVSLIEVLVVVSVVGLLVAVAMPSITAARQEGFRVRCLRNLKSLGEYGGQYSAGDRRGILHPQSTSGERDWIGLGAWDFGGGDGADVLASSEYVPTEIHLGAATRPFNLMAFGPVVGAASRFAEYECPQDVGLAPERCRETLATAYHESHARACGTSYVGENLLMRQDGACGDAKGPGYLRYGAFMRPSSHFPRAAETLLFYEARLPQAIIHAQEFVGGGSPYGCRADRIAGWHGRGSEFSAVLADGHVQTISVRMAGDLFEPAAPGEVGEVRTVRGRGWRYDCLPAEPVCEHYVGNP